MKENQGSSIGEDLQFQNLRVTGHPDNATCEPVVRTWKTWIPNPVAQIQFQLDGLNGEHCTHNALHESWSPSSFKQTSSNWIQLRLMSNQICIKFEWCPWFYYQIIPRHHQIWLSWRCGIISFGAISALGSPQINKNLIAATKEHGRA